MSSGDWFRNRLGVPPQQPAPPPQYPQGYQQAPPPQQYAPQQPQWPQQQQPQYQAPQSFDEYEAQRIAAGTQAMANVAAGANFNQAAQYFRGSRKLRQTENENCPECGDPRYFNRSAMSKMNESGKTVAPASVCMACGYSGAERFGNGMQQGNNPLSQAPEIVDTRSIKQITHFDPRRGEWVSG